MSLVGISAQDALLQAPESREDLPTSAPYSRDEAFELVIEAGRVGCRLRAFDLAAGLARQVLERAQQEDSRRSAEAALLLGLAQAGQNDVEQARLTLAVGLQHLGTELDSPLLLPALYLFAWLSADAADLAAARTAFAGLKALSRPGLPPPERVLLEQLRARLEPPPPPSSRRLPELRLGLASLVSALV